MGRSRLRILWVVLLAWPAMAWSAVESPQSVVDSVDLLVPESIDADLDKLMTAWRQGYASACDKDSLHQCGNEPFVYAKEVSDEVYKERLGRLPTVIPMAYNSVVRKCIHKYLSDGGRFIRSMITLGDYYFPDMEEIFDREGLPVELIYLSIVESALDPTVRSRSGATGLWQFVLSTGKAYGLRVDSYVDERRDVRKSTEAAAKYFKDMYAIYGDWLLVIASYNCGPGSVNRAIRRAGGSKDYWVIYPYLPHETRNYIPMFIAAYYAVYYHQEHHVCVRERKSPLAVEQVVVHRNVTFEAIAQMAGVEIAEVRALNPQYRRGVVPGRVSPSTVTLSLPAAMRLSEQVDALSAKGDSVASNVAEPKVSRVSKSARKASVRYKTYRVKRGDTLGHIARRHRVSLRRLLRANGFSSQRTMIRPGQKLRIPSR